MAATEPHRIRTISEIHAYFGLPKPQHPLISVITIQPVTNVPADLPKLIVTDLYIISLKKNFQAPVKIKYGQQTYDFDEGVLSFMAPGQLFGMDLEKNSSPNQAGWMLFVHPDFLWHTSLATKIRQYAFFDYSVNEALFLSDKEERISTHLIENIEQEYVANIDPFSQTIIVSQLESLLNYADRFYQRQFITRTIGHHTILERLETVLAGFFSDDTLADKGLPTVQTIADALHLSPNYLSSVLQLMTGKGTQQHIHDKLIERAKERLSTTDLSVSEIAYTLGFTHSQSFSRLFKSKTALSPVAFRNSFN